MSAPKALQDKYNPSTPICLTFAGSDSGGEAGIQADLQVFNHFQCHATNVITAVTAQNPNNISEYHPLPAQSIKSQWKTLNDYFSVAAAKCGMLGDIQTVQALCDIGEDLPNLVIDPVFLSSSGRSLLDTQGLQLARETLYPKATILTPNLPEARFLCNSPEGEAKELVQKLSQTFQCAIYLKGGHDKQHPSLDYFYCGKALYSLEAPQLELKSSHGTGCRLSAALCCGIAQELTPLDNALRAKAYVYACLNNCSQDRLGNWLIGGPSTLQPELIDIQTC